MNTDQLGGEYDERQLVIRGQVFKHGLYVAVGLLGITAMLQASDVVWASGFAQNCFIITATAAVVIIEAIMRGAYFGRGDHHWLTTATSFVVGLGFIAMHTVRALKPASMSASDHVVFIVAGALFCCIAAVGIVKMLVDRRASRFDEPEVGADRTPSGAPSTAS